MQHHTFEIPCHGQTLFNQLWTDKAPAGVVVLVHGMGEHGGRYAESVVPRLLEENFAVFATDHFGHGRTTGKRGVCPGYEAVLDSIDLSINKAKQTYSELPVFLYGHSMGGNAVLGYTMTRKPEIKGVISTSPMLKLAFEPPAWKIGMGKFLGKVMPGLTMPSGLDPEHISRDPQAVKAYKEDPLNHYKVGPNFVFPFLEMAEWIMEHPEELEIPALLCHGTGDLITSYQATAGLGEKAENASLKMFEGGYHELQNDLGKEAFFQVITQWLRQNRT